LPSAGAAPPPELAKFARFCAALTLDTGEAMQLEPFQREALADYFAGATETLILLSKKNGKTTLLAALALYHLCSTVDAECVVGAASRDQASELYRQATKFVARSDGLQQRVIAKSGFREIRSKRPGDSGRIRVLAADVDTADGVIPTLALVDELHRHKSAGLYGVFRDGLGPRDGQQITISTAGDSEGSPLGVMRAAAHRLRDLERPDSAKGRYLRGRSADGGFAFHEWALLEGDDVDDLKVVKLVNPASWQTIAKLRRRHDSPSTLPWQWARFACGIWMAAESWWITGEAWQAARADDPSAALEPGDRIAVGFDGSRYHDATALIACRIEDGLLSPIEIWEEPEQHHGREWEVPAGSVEAALARAMELYRVERLYADPPLWQTEIDEWARLYGAVVQRFPTSRIRMTTAVERFRTDVGAGVVHHDGDERLSRHIMNAQTREARTGYWLEKPRAGTAGNIDAAVAAVLAYEARCDVIGSAEAEVDRGEFAFL
jgi:phage terminase large subunit-like protein